MPLAFILTGGADLGGRERRRVDGPGGRQGNCRTKHIVRIVAVLGSDKPRGVVAVAVDGTLHIVPGKQVRIPVRERHRAERLSGIAGPAPMSMRLEFVTSIREGGEDLDQHMVAAKSEPCPCSP